NPTRSISSIRNTGRSMGKIEIQGHSGDDEFHFHVRKNNQHQEEESSTNSQEKTPYLRPAKPTQRRRVKSNDYDYDYHSDNVFDRHESSSSSGKDSKSYKSSKSHKSSKSNKSGKSSKGKGEGKGKGGHSYDYDHSPGHPSTPPNEMPSISMEPSMAPPPSQLTPTRPRTEMPAANRPTAAPAGSNQDGQCSPDSAGLFGSQLGFAEVYEYSYEITTIPGVTADELNRFVLPNVEIVLSENVLEDLFESCNPDTSTTTTVERESLPQRTAPPTPTPLNGYVLVGDTYVYQGTSTSSERTQRSSSQAEGYQKESYQKTRRGRRLQFPSPPQQLEGVSTQPADVVAEGVECVNQEISSLNCFVIRGSMTTYSREKPSDATQAYVQNIIDTTLIETTDELQESDNRLIGFEYRDTTQDPLPPLDPTDDDTPTADDDDFVVSPTQSPVVRPDEKANEFGEPWHYALIAVGACLIIAMIYLCIRRPKSKRFFVSSSEDDDGMDPSSASEESDGDDFRQEAVAALAATTNAFGEPSSPSSSHQSPSQSSNAFGLPDDEEEEESYEIPVDEDDEYGNEQSLSQEEVFEMGREDVDGEEVFSVEEDEEMDDEGEWVEEEDFEDEPTYDVRLNDEPSAFGANNEIGAAEQGFETDAQAAFSSAMHQSYEVESPDGSPQHRKPDSSTSFSVAIARAMSQAQGEKHENEFSPFDQIHDDNIYGATAGGGATEYEFNNNMPMNSSHHADSSAASSEFEEVSVDSEELDEEEYDVEYATESSGDEFEEDYISDADEEEESYGSSYESR
ncbi:MAG: hypothetical protein SGILL_008368, partial [Bacillariaceae sp.]